MEVTWFLGRDMFAAGLLAPSGDGDIGVWPSCGPQHARLLLSFQGTDGEATVEADLDMFPDRVRQLLVGRQGCRRACTQRASSPLPGAKDL
ncbi:SsgA family sporulation/cell division regulator [Streptomyces sp. NPDC005483]|uniref:SsgA family sporulation/cell division regulator n=1 Tax=Streptomyces sp. NPDC005483 TaxID=3154882 RepID=UPI0033B0A766